MESQSQWTCQIWIRKVNGPECNMHHQTYHFAKTHNIFHISYHVVHIFLSYAMRPWDHGLDVRTSLNEGSTCGTSTREPSLANTESASFIHTYFIFIHLYT